MNTKGFTMLELLATIIILGLLTTLGYVSVRAILDRGDESYYDSQEDMLLLAGREYFADYRENLPKEIGDTSSVALKTLIEEKYIDPVKDNDEEDCDGENSTVVAQKITDRDYQYYATLACGSYTTSKDNSKPVISFSPNRASSEESITVTMRATDNGTVKSYRYVIEKDGEEYFDSSYQTYTGDVTINLTEKGLYQITGYAIDDSGNMNDRKSGTYSIYSEINCAEVSFSSTTAAGSWANKNINVTISFPSNAYRYEITDSYNNSNVGSYVGNSDRTITLVDQGSHTLKVNVYDQHGNSCTATSGSYNIDRTQPTCGTISGASTSWTNSSRTISVGCNDTGGSGCVSNPYKQTYRNYTRTASITISDKAGNTNSCSFNVYVDPNYNAQIYPNTGGACTLVGTTLRTYSRGWTVYDGMCSGYWTTQYYQVYSSNGYTLTPCYANGWPWRACPRAGHAERSYTKVNDSGYPNY